MWWKCGKGLTDVVDLHVHTVYALRRCSHKGGFPIASRAFCYPWKVGNAVPQMLMA